MNETKLGVAQPPPGGLPRAQTRMYRKGDTVIQAGGQVHEWIAISKGAVSISTVVVRDERVAVATLWFGDVVGRGSPLGRSVAGYDVHALVDVETVAMPQGGHPGDSAEDAPHLYNSTATRLNRQIAMRLAGNGPQRFLSVLATLAMALIQRPMRAHQPLSLAIPVGQACLGQMAGLSRRQVWVYLGELTRTGWVQTSRTRIDLVNLSCWLRLQSEVEHRGLACISTIDSAIETLSMLSRKAVAA